MQSINWTLPQKLECSVQAYGWGGVGPEAYIARLLGWKAPTNPMAEIWMGAHTKAPSKIQGIGLDEWIKKFPSEILGAKAGKKLNQGLPYLFKVLSANEALSIQLHPSKGEAEKLHAKDPKNYPDDNHKPEIAIALDGLEALLGFDTLENIVAHFEAEPEMADFLGEALVSELREALGAKVEVQNQKLKKVFAELFELSQRDKPKLKTCTMAMATRLKKSKLSSPRSRWFVELQQQYPEGDVGLFCLYFLKYSTMQAGEAVFLRAGVPHAYLRGNIIECMANSDNVVRAGLTPKFVDVETLAKIVVVEQDSLKVQFGQDNGLGGKIFKVTIPEFEVHHWKNDQAEVSVDVGQLSGARILVVISGRVSCGDFCAKQGEVVLLADACKKSLQLSHSGEFYLARPNGQY